MPTFSSDFYADLHSARGSYVVPNYADQVDERRRKQELSKASKKGEGTRGGHIVGHTKSGKPVYERSKPSKVTRRGVVSSGTIGHTSNKKRVISAVDHDGPYLHVRGDPDDPQDIAKWGAHLAAAFPEYSARDHREAAAMHAGQNQKLLRQGRWGEALAPELASLGHKHAATMVKTGAHSGEVSHVGNVVGHTRSGKDIHQEHGADHPAYKGFSGSDHRDAIEVHGHLHDFHRSVASLAASKADGRESPVANSLNALSRMHHQQAEMHNEAAESHFNAAHPELMSVRQSSANTPRSGR